MTLENDGYFGRLCNFFNSSECIEKAKEAETGAMSKEAYYEWLIKTFGEEEVARAHKHAATTPISSTASAREEIAEKIRTLQEKKNPQVGKLPAAPSSIDELCRICVTPVSIGIFSVLQQWHVENKEKEELTNILNGLEKEEIPIEEAYVRVLTEIPDSMDSLNRILDDLNRVLEYSLEKASEKKPELKARFEKELQEMRSES